MSMGEKPRGFLELDFLSVDFQGWVEISFSVTSAPEDGTTWANPSKRRSTKFRRLTLAAFHV